MEPVQLVHVPPTLAPGGKALAAEHSRHDSGCPSASANPDQSRISHLILCRRCQAAAPLNTDMGTVGFMLIG
eukprot:850630-Amphidinium_carterae.1